MVTSSTMEFPLYRKGEILPNFAFGITELEVRLKEAPKHRMMSKTKRRVWDNFGTYVSGIRSEDKSKADKVLFKNTRGCQL